MPDVIFVNLTPHTIHLPTGPVEPLGVSDPRIAELEGQVALLTAALANAEGQNPETWTAT